MTNWQTKKLGDVLDKIEGGGTPSKEKPEYWNGSIPWASVKDLTTFNPKRTQDYISEEGLRNSSSKLVKAGTLITPTRMALGFTVRFDVDVAINQDLKALYPKEDTAVDYLKYWFESNRNKIEKLGVGSTVAGIQVSELKTQRISLPEKPEQERIVGVLEVWDEYIEQLERKIALKEQLKKGLMQQLLIGKRRLPGFTSEWRTEKVSDLFDIKNGYTPSKRQKEFWQDGTIPWFRMEDIRKNGRILSDSIQRITPAAVKGGGLFPANSIIIATTATIGEHALLIADSLANQQFTFLTRKVNCLDLLDPMFVYYACFDLSEWCKKNTNSGGLTAVDMNGFKKYKFPVPDIAEQTAIVDVLQNAEQTVSLLKQEKQMAVNQKKYLLQNLITGKIRTPENMEIAK